MRLILLLFHSLIFYNVPIVNCIWRPLDLSNEVTSSDTTAYDLLDFLRPQGHPPPPGYYPPPPGYYQPPPPEYYRPPPPLYLDHHSPDLLTTPPSPTTMAPVTIVDKELGLSIEMDSETESSLEYNQVNLTIGNSSAWLLGYNQVKLEVTHKIQHKTKWDSWEIYLTDLEGDERLATLKFERDFSSPDARYELTVGAAVRRLGIDLALQASGDPQAEEQHVVEATMANREREPADSKVGASFESSRGSSSAATINWSGKAVLRDKKSGRGQNLVIDLNTKSHAHHLDLDIDLAEYYFKIVYTLDNVAVWSGVHYLRPYGPILFGQYLVERSLCRYSFFYYSQFSKLTTTCDGFRHWDVDNLWVPPYNFSISYKHAKLAEGQQLLTAFFSRPLEDNPIQLVDLSLPNLRGNAIAFKVRLDTQKERVEIVLERNGTTIHELELQRKELADSLRYKQAGGYVTVKIQYEYNYNFWPLGYLSFRLIERDTELMHFSIGVVNEEDWILSYKLLDDLQVTSYLLGISDERKQIGVTLKFPYARESLYVSLIGEKTWLTGSLDLKVKIGNALYGIVLKRQSPEDYALEVTKRNRKVLSAQVMYNGQVISGNGTFSTYRSDDSAHDIKFFQKLTGPSQEGSLMIDQDLDVKSNLGDDGHHVISYNLGNATSGQLLVAADRQEGKFILDHLSGHFQNWRLSLLATRDFLTNTSLVLEMDDKPDTSIGLCKLNRLETAMQDNNSIVATFVMDNKSILRPYLCKIACIRTLESKLVLIKNMNTETFSKIEYADRVDGEKQWHLSLDGLDENQTQWRLEYPSLVARYLNHKAVTINFDNMIIRKLDDNLSSFHMLWFFLEDAMSSYLDPRFLDMKAPWYKRRFEFY